MTASLYQSGSSGGAVTACCAAASSSSVDGFMKALQEIVEVALAAHARAQAQDMRRGPLRVEHHEVAGAVPQEALVGQQVVHLVRAVRGKAEHVEIELQPAGLGVVRVEVHHGEDRVVAA